MIRLGRYRAEQKLDLIRRHRQGETLQLGTDRYGRDLLTKWESLAPIDATEAEILRRLRWTEDDGEIPSIGALRERAGHFPTKFLQPGMTVLCLFCARFFGRSDVIHVHDAGAAHATLVDTDSQRLEEMRLIYPSHWSYIADDYAAYLDRAAAIAEKFDVVIADPWAAGPMASDVAWNWLMQIMSMSALFITGYYTPMFEELGIEPDDLASLSKTLSDQTGRACSVLQVTTRNPAAYWVVIGGEL